MDFKNFSDFSFYDLITRISQPDWENLSWAVQMYMKERFSTGQSSVDLRSCVDLLEEKKADPHFRFRDSAVTVKLKESLFHVARALGQADINWQNPREVEVLWENKSLWQKDNLLKLKVDSFDASSNNRKLVDRLQAIFEKEYEQRVEQVFQFFLELWHKGFLSPGETKKMESLQKAIKMLTKHENIIDSHKLQGLEALREQMRDFQNTLPINSRQLTAFLTLAKKIRENLDFFKKVNDSLKIVRTSYTNLIAILGEEATPESVYKDWFNIIIQHKRGLQKVILVSDVYFLKEVLTTLHKKGWKEELINLAPSKRDVYRLLLTYPQEWPDVVDAYRSFGEFIKDWQKSLSKSP